MTLRNSSGKWAVATILLLAATACTQDELADDTRLYPLIINATGLQAVATPASTRATVDGNWDGVTSVALSVGGMVKEYSVTTTDTEKKTATLSRENDPFWWTSREDITVSAWWPREPDRAVRQPEPDFGVQPPHGAGDNQPEARHRHHERGWCHGEPDEPVSR